MISESQLLGILGTALTTSSSFNVLIITFLLGQYATLDRQDRPSREKKPYYLSLLLLFAVLWVAGIALALLIGAVYFNSKIYLISSLILFLVQLSSLIMGLSWVGYKTVI